MNGCNDKDFPKSLIHNIHNQQLLFYKKNAKGIKINKNYHL